MLNSIPTVDPTAKSLVVDMVCHECGEQFPFNATNFGALGYTNVPKKCPTCIDQNQYQDDINIVVSGGRKMLEEFIGVEIKLPHDFFKPFKARKGDRGGLRATIRGRDLLGGWNGKSWDGRLDVYIPRCELVPKIGRVRIMQVEHKSGHTRIEKHGEPMRPKEEVKVEYSPTYTYIVIEPMPVDTEPTMALVLASVDFKTTLKGFGRQWGCEFDISQTLWSCHLSNRARSGRFGQQGCIAIVDDEHPVTARQIGGVTSERRWNFSNSSGRRDEWLTFAECQAKTAWQSAYKEAQDDNRRVVDISDLQKSLGVDELKVGESIQLDDSSLVMLYDIEPLIGWAVIKLEENNGNQIFMQITIPREEEKVK